jgi:hypothetical protein
MRNATTEGARIPFLLLARLASVLLKLGFAQSTSDAALF